MQPCKNTPGETSSVHVKGGVATEISNLQNMALQICLYTHMHNVMHVFLLVF